MGAFIKGSYSFINKFLLTTKKSVKYKEQQDEGPHIYKGKSKKRTWENRRWVAGILTLEENFTMEAMTCKVSLEN